jgi:hypothetical protein
MLIIRFILIKGFAGHELISSGFMKYLFEVARTPRRPTVPIAPGFMISGLTADLSAL